MTYDVAIIGTGPAGLSAAINLKLHNKSFIWLGAKNLSTKVEKSEKIANYPGMGYISGKDLIGKFEAHAEEMGLEITEQMVTDKKLRKSRMEARAGKITRAEIRRDPTRFMAKTMMTAIITAISRL
jgi:thioredoxin reductase